MRRKVNNSETHETKIHYEVPSEKVEEWSDTIENLTKQCDQFKAERDTLIDDLPWYKAKVSRLERELKDFDNDYEMVTNNCIYWEDKAHWLEDESSKYINLLSEISQHIGNKPSSSTYKYFRAKLDELGIEEGE